MTAGTYKDLAGNAGTSDLNATVPVLLLSMDSVLGSTSSSTHLSSASMAGVIVGVILGACFTALLCFLVGMHVSSGLQSTALKHCCWWACNHLEPCTR